MTGPSTNGASPREFYLNGADAAEELGLTPYKLSALQKATGIGAREKGRGCRYTASDIGRLRAIVGLMHKYPISPAAAAKIHADIQANKATQAAASQPTQAARTVADRIPTTLAAAEPR